VQHETLGIYEQMPLLALDLLARVVAVRVNRRPPFSALLTLWLLFSVAAPPVKPFIHLVSSSSLPGLALLFVVGTLGRHSMGSEDEVEQSVKRAHCGKRC
jgi:uncharacterized membrane protein YoaK (UPF0700 family)